MRNLDVPSDPAFALLGRSIWRPTGRVALGGRFPGLKPWAEFCSPSGHNLSPTIVAFITSFIPVPEGQRRSYRPSGTFRTGFFLDSDDAKAGGPRGEGAKNTYCPRRVLAGALGQFLSLSQLPERREGRGHRRNGITTKTQRKRSSDFQK
jgi:hypothetical protein